MPPYAEIRQNFMCEVDLVKTALELGAPIIIIIIIIIIPIEAACTSLFEVKGH